MVPLACRATDHVWADKQVEIAITSAVLAVLTLVFVFLGQATRNARVFWWFRMGSLTVTLVFLAEVEPFKTAIILKFVRAWPFVAYVVGLLPAGSFVERFYCRYLCPLGGALQSRLGCTCSTG